MGKPYSLDLRKRVVAAVVTGGLSCNQAAKHFGVAVSTAIGWVRRQRETGSVAPGKMGGHRQKAISGEHRAIGLKSIFYGTAFDAADEGYSNLSQDWQSSCCPASTRSYEAGEHRPLSRN